MKDFRFTNIVVQDNNLIQAINRLDRTTFKIFEMAVSCIDTKNPQQTVYLSKKDIFSFFDMQSSNRYTRMEEAFIRLSQQGISVQLPDKRKRLINVTSTFEWGTESGNDEVMIRFNDLVMPYLVDLKENFTQYQITEIKDLSSKYSLILFKWLMMKRNHYQNNPIIPMSELRELTDTTKEYEEFSNFDRRVLKIAIKEINKYTTLNVDYTKITRKGRKISDIQFHIEDKDLSNAIEMNLVAEEKDNEDIHEMYALFSQELKQNLSESDKTIIRLLNDQYGATKLIDALRTALGKGSTSLRYIETVLRSDI